MRTALYHVAVLPTPKRNFVGVLEGGGRPPPRCERFDFKSGFEFDGMPSDEPGASKFGNRLWDESLSHRRQNRCRNNG